MKTIDWIIRSPTFKGISGATEVDDRATDAEIIAEIQGEFLAALTVHWPYRSGDMQSDGPGHTFTPHDRGANELGSSERLGPRYDGTRSITSSSTLDGGSATTSATPVADRATDGWVMVPREPTAAMIEAGCDANPTQWNEGTDDGFGADVASDIYSAMVASVSRAERSGAAK